MSKVTSKLQVTIPKAIATAYGIEPGSNIEFVPAGDGIRVEVGRAASPADPSRPLALFDAASQRQAHRNSERAAAAATDGRGWTRDDLYERDVAR